MAKTQEEIFDGFKEIIAEEADDVDVDAIRMDQSFIDDLEVDSLTMMTIATLAEEKFSVTIPDDKLAELVTVGDAVEFVAHAQKG